MTMPAKVIDGKKIAADIRAAIKKEIEDKGLHLKISSVFVGSSDAAEVYIGQKKKACAEVGIGFTVMALPERTTEKALFERIRELNEDKKVTGILVELPLPSHISIAKVSEAIRPNKDLDGMNPANYGKLLVGERCLAPSTPSAVMEILEREEVKLEGTEVTIVSHSNIVGKPLALMLLKKNASLKVAHVYTKDLKAYTREAEVLVTAAGVPNLIKADMVKDGAVVIDVAMNRVDGKLCGDVAFEEVSRKARAITPVPGGVGPVTVSMVLRNTLFAHSMQERNG
jgi:methylenetetrahydrofolate dehydrogenase (NADP+)/methenyltetrahydrofolate cyclohydrolase